MSAAAQVQAEKRREIRSYFVGFVVAVLLTAVPFALVWSETLTFPVLAWVIGIAGLFQVLVHFRFFLHIGLSRSKRDDLQLILFTALIILLMAGGTVWILGNLHQRMM